MQEQIQIPVPIALKELILTNNMLLKQYQAELTSKVISANEEMMKILGITPADGWKLDVDTMSYVKEKSTDAPSVS